MTAELTVPREAYALRESASLQEAGLDSDGTVAVHIIRPGVGRGRGRHLYEADMLAENAHKFTGWRMYVDHLAPEARRKAGGLPRSMHDLGGVITESYWDPNVPADASRGYGQGAVVGRAKPVNLAKKLIEEAPEIVEASICANATGVRKVQHNGQHVWLVEGIEDRGSVDWVTEGGAGGRVVALMESLVEAEDMELSNLTDEEFTEYLAEHRPALLEALAEADSGDGDGSDDEGAKDDDLEKTVQKLIKKGMPEKVARKMAKRAVSEAVEGDDMGVTPEMLQEALASDAFREQVDSLVEARMQERLEEVLQAVVGEHLQGLVEAAVEEEREVIHEEARAKADRQIDLRDIRDEAHKRIEEARLPDAWKAPIRAKFDLREGEPTTALDQIDEVDEDGKVTQTARQKVEEAVISEIAAQRELLAAARPTQVRGQGPTAEDGGTQDDKKPKLGGLTAALLQEAGVDPDKAWAE